MGGVCSINRWTVAIDAPLPVGRGREQTNVSKIGAIAAVTAVLLAACTSSAGRWERPGTSPDDAAAMEIECRDAARADVEQRFSPRGTMGSSPSSNQPRDITGNWTSMMDQYSAESHERQLFERCMTRQGFQFVPFSQ